MSLQRQLILHVLLLGGIVAFFEATDLDLTVQDRFYQGNRRWLIDDHAKVPRLLLYTGPKALLIVLGAGCFVAFVASYKVHRLRAFRLPCLQVALALAAIPLTVASLKAFTNVYTPNKVLRYGGRQPYVKVLGQYPTPVKWSSRGRGWPAGHASGGFALMILYHALRRQRWRVLGLCLGLAVGWAMGLYQMLNGEHYLSHTVVTMSGAWILVLVIALATRRRAAAPAAPAGP